LVSLRRGGVHISLSTISVALSDRLAAEHAKAGQGYLAAPVFGRPDAAGAARLAVVVAGADPLVQKCKPLFEALGQSCSWWASVPRWPTSSSFLATF